MDKTLTFTVNGESRTVTTDPERPLLEVLREDLGLTGSKYGCGEGRCGACTVLVGDRNTSSCITPVGQVENQSVLTIEGLAKGEDELHPIQEAFLAEGAFQCGYCTPGMIMAVAALLRAKPDPTDDDILTTLNGHICRCCGYPAIRSAIRRAAAAGRL
ncbi:MAG: (2Fe-2S)-binding protein [Planctomycetota bacterium]